MNIYLEINIKLIVDRGTEQVLKEVFVAWSYHRANS